MTYGASGSGKTHTMFGKSNILGISQLLIKKNNITKLILIQTNYKLYLNL